MPIRPAIADDHGAYTRLFPELGVPDAPLPRDNFETEVLPNALVARGATPRFELFKMSLPLRRP